MNDVNLNIAECLVRKTGFAYDYVYNICNKEVQTLPWSFTDWIGFIGGTVAFVFFLLASLFFLWSLSPPRWWFRRR